MKQLSITTRSFLTCIYIVGASILAMSMTHLRNTESVLLGILCFLGAILHILKVEGATNRSHYTLSFLVFGFALAHFGISEAVLVILISNLAEWIWNRPPWFIQLFNISCYVVAIRIGGGLYSAINPSGVMNSWNAILAIVVGMAGFTFINHLLVGIIVWLARGEDFQQSGIFGSIPLLIDLTMMSIGASMSLVWQYNPYALLIFLIPSYPLYMALKIPELERKSESDLKTGLFNHHYFMAQFHNELQRANRYDRPLSIIMADLDLLRNINNTYGHLAGDEVLKGVADILRRTVREYDLVARFGGEEFAILMPEAEIDKAIQRAEYIRKAIEAAGFIVPTSIKPIKATMSFGISKRESFEQSTEEIIHHADTALYHSKLNGRNITVAYMNNTFMKADPKGFAHGAPPATEEIPSEEISNPDYDAAVSTYLQPTPETSQNSVKPEPLGEEEEKIEENGTSHGTRKKVQRYIAFVALSALFIFAVPVHLYAGVYATFSSADWLGLAAIAFTIILTEWFSINLYVRNTSLSTSAVPIIAMIVLFGPLGTLIASLSFALTAAIKFRSPFNRVVFNFSNHVITGTIINILIYLKEIGFANRGHPVIDLATALASSLILFLFTTTFISIGIGLDLKRSPKEIWKEQYQWMAPYYLGMGFISYTLMFGYGYAGLLGIVTMLIPLSLLRISQAQYVEHTRVVVNELRQKNHQLERSSVEIGELNEGLLETLSVIIDLRDPYVLGHSRMVSKYAAEIASLMKLSDRQIELLRKGGLLHDIGKLGVAMEILTKPGKLTREEYQNVKDHAALGGDLVKNSPSLRPLVPIIRHHHEYYNGEGYPDGLAGNKIPVEARIVAVADAIEAMSSDRPYRRAFPRNRIIKELRDHTGTQFDPIVVQSAIRMLATGSVAEQEAIHRTDTQLRLSQRFALQGQSR